MIGRFNFLLVSLILCYFSAASQGIFQKIFSDSGDVFAKSSVQTSDVNYVFTGGNYAVGASYPHVFLSKSNPLGDLIWFKNYDIETSNLWESICNDGSDGFALAGTTISNQSVDLHVIKTDSSGNVLWSK